MAQKVVDVSYRRAVGWVPQFQRAVIRTSDNAKVLRPRHASDVFFSMGRYVSQRRQFTFLPKSSQHVSSSIGIYGLDLILVCLQRGVRGSDSGLGTISGLGTRVWGWWLEFGARLT